MTDKTEMTKKTTKNDKTMTDKTEMTKETTKKWQKKMTGKTEMTKNMTKKPTKNDKLNIWTISRVWLRVSSNDTAMSGNFWITFSFLLWCLSWTFAAAIGMGLACQWQCIDGEMHQFYFGTWKKCHKQTCLAIALGGLSISFPQRENGWNKSPCMAKRLQTLPNSLRTLVA